MYFAKKRVEISKYLLTSFQKHCFDSPFTGATAKHVDLQVHRPLPRGGIHMATQAVHGRPGDHHLVRGAAHLVSFGIHLHWVGRHSKPAAGRLEAIRWH